MYEFLEQIARRALCPWILCWIDCTSSQACGLCSCQTSADTQPVALKRATYEHSPVIHSLIYHSRVHSGLHTCMHPSFFASMDVIGSHWAAQSHLLQGFCLTPYYVYMDGPGLPSKQHMMRPGCVAAREHPVPCGGGHQGLLLLLPAPTILDTSAPSPLFGVLILMDKALLV